MLKKIFCLNRLSIVLLVFYAGTPVSASQDAEFMHFIVEDFQSYEVRQSWPGVKEAIVTKDCGLGELNNKCIRVRHVPSDNGTPWLAKQIKIPKSKHTILSYDLFFEEDFEFVQGGKLPGLTSEIPGTGCRDLSPSSWSARPMWRSQGRLENYYYSQNRSNYCGEGETSTDFKFTKGSWYHIDVNVKLNSNGTEPDGHFVISIDGKVIVASHGLKFRSEFDESSLINILYFDSFFGGNDPSWSPSKRVFARYDNFEIYTSQTASQFNTNSEEFRVPQSIFYFKKPQPPMLLQEQPID